MTVKQRDFALIALLIGMTLITVLSEIGVAPDVTSVTRAKEAVLAEDLFRMRNAIEQFNADKRVYPPELSALVIHGYMRQIPKDPITDSADTWQIVMSEPDPANSNVAPGVYNVHSGAEGTAMDGRQYVEW